ncbi:MAG: VWA domain-containing protein [Trueperaceae bacterium]
MNPFFSNLQQERERRWRLILGKGEQGQQSQQEQVSQSAPSQDEEQSEGQGQGEGQGQLQLPERDRALDETLDALYGEGDLGGSGDSAPDVARWLGDIRKYFPSSVAQLLQQDALKKLKLQKLLESPEALAEIKPDIHLVTKLIALSKLIPSQTRETARQVVAEVVEELKKRLEYPLLQALQGALNRSVRTRKPRRQKDINWLHTVKANLKHYQPEYRTVVPETLIGYGRERSSLHDVILCLDQSGSMARSIVYSSIFGAVMASVPALSTKLVLFDTKIVDMTGKITDPVDLLFGVNLQGGTNIERALTYCQQLVTRPRDTVLVLISDLFEGGNKDMMLRRVASLLQNGVTIVVLLALDDAGAPKFNRSLATELAELGVPSFACTPELFPELMSAAIRGEGIKHWAASNDIMTAA